MSETERFDPCLSLMLEPNGAVTLTVSAQLQPDVKNWTPEEAGLWLTRSWERAEQALIGFTIQRVAVSGGEMQIVAQGDNSWTVVIPSPLIATERQVISQPVRGIETEEVTIPDGEEVTIPDGEETLDLEPEPVPVTRNRTKKILANEDEKRIIRSLSKGVQPISAPDLARQTGLSPYRVKKALESLLDKQMVQEDKVPSRGRWGEMAVYSSAVQGVSES